MKTLRRQSAIRGPGRHKGFVLIAVLVCLGFIGALMLASLQTSLRQRRQIDRELQREQTRWLAQAAMRHAEDRIRSAKDETEFQPVLLKPDLGPAGSAEVKIDFSSAGETVRVDVSAWMGLAGRPETQTRENLKQEIQKNRSMKPTGETK